MKIKEGFVIREVAGKFVVIATGEASKNFHGMITLNKTGRDIWQGLQEGLTEKEIAEHLCSKYDVDRESAMNDVRKMVEDFTWFGFCAED